MSKKFLRRLSKANLEYATYIVTKDKNLTPVQMQQKIKEVFKTSVPIWEIEMNLIQKGAEDFSVEHRKIEYGHNNDKFKSFKKASTKYK